MATMGPVGHATPYFALAPINAPLFGEYISKIYKIFARAHGARNNYSYNNIGSSVLKNRKCFCSRLRHLLHLILFSRDYVLATLQKVSVAHHTRVGPYKRSRILATPLITVNCVTCQNWVC